MPSQVLTSVENNFTKGLITESTGLNFPENAATDTDNCTYTLIGDVTRREGINYEDNFSTNTVDRTNCAISSYKWNNAGGDGNTQVVVEQIGSNLYFYLSSSATVVAPLSIRLLPNTLSISSFVADNALFDNSVECQFSDGNGYLFVFHPNCDPFFCTFNVNTKVITGSRIGIQIRDFTGIPDGFDLTTRVANASNTLQHQYNLVNQGWGAAWSAGTLTSMTVGVGSHVFTTTTANLPAHVGDIVTLSSNTSSIGMTGTISSYDGNVTMSVVVYATIGTGTSASWSIEPINGYSLQFGANIGSFPSNADMWWTFKTTTGAFNPITTLGQTALLNSPAPKGSIILTAFQQNRDAVFTTIIGSIPSIPGVNTVKRPRTGAWFQGRVWYTGVDDTSFSYSTPYSWTENIYFSQIVQTTADFGLCYQINDPTSETLFDILPTDGGVIQIQGCGSIYKLFPIANGMLVFAANGVWFITGSQGIGFSANDYTITKISSVESISSTSFVNVLGLPYFWNEEGIYQVMSTQNGSLQVSPITVGTIQSFFNDIPLQSKKYVRGDYHPIDYVIQWSYRNTNEINVTSRYQFDTILNYNTYNKAFFPYSLPVGDNPYIHGVMFVQGPGGSSSPPPAFKYFTSAINPNALGYDFTFSEENSEDFVDFKSAVPSGVTYSSYFVTGYKLHGQAQRRFQMPYIYVFNRMTGDSLGYNIQGIWDYAADRNSNRWSVPQTVLIAKSRFTNIFRRHRIRGQGLVLQLKVFSVDGQPFDIMGWSVFEQQNTGV